MRVFVVYHVASLEYAIRFGTLSVLTRYIFCLCCVVALLCRMVVDYKLFTPGSPPQPGTLWMIEQIPGFMQSTDLTSYLSSNGAYRSYNVPYFTEFWNLTGYGDLDTKWGSDCKQPAL